jgi:hypothetical protein
VTNYTYKCGACRFDEPLDEREYEERLVRLEAAVHAIEARLDIQPLPPALKPSPEPDAPASAIEPDSGLDMALIGKSVLIIGGAYVLRALTELGVLGPLTGVILALVYALFWVGSADRALSRGLRIVALFHAGTAAIIAGPLLWEATTRFQLVTPAVAITLLLAVVGALLVIALHQHSTTMALTAVILATSTSIGIAIGTVSLASPLLATTLLGILLSWLSARTRWPMFVALIPAAASDTLALALIVMTAMGNAPYSIASVEVALVAFAGLWLITPATWTRGQSVMAVLVGLNGAAFLAAFHNGHPTAVAVASLTMGAAAYVVCAMRRSVAMLIAGAVAALIGSMLVLSPFALAIAWSVAGVTSAAIGRRVSWRALHVHAACCPTAAAIATGLPVLLASALFASGATLPSPRLPLIVVGVLSAVTLWLSDRDALRSRLTLLAITTSALLVLALADGSAMANRPLLAMTRTAALAIVAVALSFLGRIVAEGRTLAWIVLVLGGVKLLAQDLTAGNAVTLVFALALYGGAIVLVAHGRAARATA